MLDAIDWEILIWLVAGAISAFGELLTGTLFLWPFAVGALVAAIVAAAGAGLVWVITTFFVVTFLVLAVVFRFAAVARDEPPATHEGAHRYVDAHGLVTSDILTPDAGRVRLGTELWRAISGTGEAIPAGAEVRVIEIRGNAVVVEPHRNG